MSMTIDEARDILEEQFELDPILEDDLFDSDVIIGIFNEFPELAATSITGADCYPLHIILLHQPTLELVRVTHEAHPIAVKKMDSLGYTPLHCACQFRCSSDVVCYLAEAHPQALNAIDSAFGSTPLELLVQDPACPIEALEFLATSFPGNVWKRCRDTNNEENAKTSTKKEDNEDEEEYDDKEEEEEYEEYIDEDHLYYFNPIERLIKHNNQSSEKVKALLDAYPNEKLTLSCCGPNHGAMIPSDNDGEYGSDFEDDRASQEQNQEFLGINSSVAAAIGSSCGKTNGVRVLDCQACSFTAAGYKALFEGIAAKDGEPFAEQPSFGMGLEELHINLDERDIQSDPKGVSEALENMLTTNSSIRLLDIMIRPDESNNNVESVPSHQQNSNTSKMMRMAQCSNDASAQQQTRCLFDLVLGQALARGLSKNQGIRELHIKSPFYSLDVQSLGLENVQMIIQDSKSIDSFHFEGIRDFAMPLVLGLNGRQHQAQTQPTRGICPLSSLSISNCQLTSHHAQEMVKTLSSDFFKHHLKKLHIRGDCRRNGGYKRDQLIRPEALRGVASLAGLEELNISISDIEEYRIACILEDSSGFWKEKVDSMESTLRAGWLNEVVIPCLEGGSNDGDHSNLKRFTLNGVQWKEQQEIDSVAQALQTSKLRSVRLQLDGKNEGDYTCRMDFSSLVDALREHNCHLEDMGNFLLPRDIGNDDDDDDDNDNDHSVVSPPHYPCMEIEESQKRDLRYYCKLNAAGRRMIREGEARKDDFVGLLSGVSNDTGLYYDLLRDLPQLWMR